MNIDLFARTSLPSPSANSHQIIRMANAFAKQGHRVRLLILASDRSTRVTSFSEIARFYNIDNQFTIIRIPTLAFSRSRIAYLVSSLGSFFTLTWIIRKSDADLIYGRELLSCLVATLLNKVVIYESHFPVWKGRLESLMFSLMIRRPSLEKVVVITEALKKAYEGRYQNLSDLLVVAADGADEVEGSIVDSQLGGDTKALKVGYVGHLYDGKGMEIILGLAKNLMDVEFHIVGGLDTDVERWRRRAQGDNLFFHGFISQKALPGYTQHLDICLLPNQRQVSVFGQNQSLRSQDIGEYTSPLKMFEYMAWRKPIIASDLPVLREILNESNSILVSPEHLDSWVAAIKSLHSEKRRNLLASQAHQDFLQNYTWSKRVQHVLQGLNSCKPN